MCSVSLPIKDTSESISMPNTTRELTPREVEAGNRGINDEDLSATQIQALVRTRDGSKEKWSHLKSNKRLRKVKSLLNRQLRLLEQSCLNDLFLDWLLRINHRHRH